MLIFSNFFLPKHLTSVIKCYTFAEILNELIMEEVQVQSELVKNIVALAQLAMMMQSSPELKNTRNSILEKVDKFIKEL